MKAIIINQYGSPKVLEFRELERPFLKPNQLLVQVYNSSINPVDWKIRKGSLWFFSGWNFPRLLGADFAGKVEAVGQRVTRFKPGDEIYGFVNPLIGGTYAEYVAVPDSCVEIKPNNMTFKEAAVVPLAGVTALQSLLDLGNLQPGQRVLVNGASGGVGTFAIQIAKAMLANVTGVCSPKNLEFIKRLGANNVIDYTKEDFTQQAIKYDIVFDAVGKKSFSECRKILKPQGIYISTLPTVRNLWCIWQTFFFSNQKAKLVVVQPNFHSLQLLRQLIEADKVSCVIDRIYPLQQVAEAHVYSETERAVGKIALVVRAD
jgi:NADPH:quinone reductase-like Zn-dependent oxidoreductase